MQNPANQHEPGDGRVTRGSKVLALLPGVLAVYGCADGIPTSEDGGLLPVETTTFEVRLPFSEFATDFQLFAGLGLPSLLPEAIVAHEWGGVEAHTLVRFGALPTQVFVRPSPNAPTVPDTAFVPFAGRVVLQIDTAMVRGPSPFVLEAGAIREGWDARSVNWQEAIDTVGALVPWSAPGGGDIRWLGQSEWDPAVLPDPGNGGGADDEEPAPTPFGRVTFAVDSATVVQWTDLARQDRGLVVAGRTPDSRLRIRGAQLEVDVRSMVNPDTVVTVSVGMTDMTFMYTPEPELSPEAFPVGGSPGMRATFRFQLPGSVTADPDICERLGCPVELVPSQLVYAGLELHTREASPFGFRPLAATVIELRPVLSPERLPRSPLAFPVACPTGSCPMLLPATVVDEDDFGTDPNTLVVLPLTRYLRDLLQDQEAVADPVPSTMALLFGLDALTGLEMRPMQHATFWGPGTEFEPILRLVITVTNGVPAP